MNRTIMLSLLGLQLAQVAFLWLHDWIPLGVLNDLDGLRAADPLARRLFVTAISAAPFTLGLMLSLIWARGATYPAWLSGWLWLTYGGLLLGQLRAWWWPYLWRYEPDRAARYQLMFVRTHSFLPLHNGIAPNTAHVALHLATVATLALLALAVTTSPLREVRPAP